MKMAIQWRVQGLRFTAFLNQIPLELDFKQLWLEAIGSEPDEVNSQPKRQLQVFVQKTEEYRAVLQVERERIDLVLQPLESFPPKAVYELGPFQSLSETFKEYIHQWLSVDDWPTANRVAFGATLSVEAPSIIAARQILLDMVPSLKIDIESNVEELLFQINRPRLLTIEGQQIKINRLAKWSAAQLIQTVISIGPVASYVDRTNMALLELDINSALETNMLIGPNIPAFFQGPHDTIVEYDALFQTKLFDHLIEMATEISKRGDIA